MAQRARAAIAGAQTAIATTTAASRALVGPIPFPAVRPPRAPPAAALGDPTGQAAATDAIPAPGPSAGDPQGLQLPPSAYDTLSAHIGAHRFKKRTSLAHHRAFGHWRVFLRDHLGTDDVYLRGEPDVEVKAQAFALFSVYLFEERKLREKDHAATRAGVRHLFEEALVDTGFMDRQTSRMAAQSTRRSTAESRSHAEANSRRIKLPLPGEVEVALRSALFEGTQWGTWEGSFARTTYVALSWAESHGLRASNFTFPGPSEEDHCLRARDVMFKIKRVNVRETVPAHAITADIQPEDVRGFTSMVYTHKRGEVKPAQRAKHTDRTESPEQSALVDLMLEYAQQARLQPDDPFFTVYRSRPPGVLVHRKVLRRRDISEAIKTACISVGLPPESFASSSLRKTAATKSGLDSDPDAHAAAANRAIWATNAGGRSSTMAAHYDFTGRPSRKPTRSSPPEQDPIASRNRPRIPLDLVRGMLPPPVAPPASTPAVPSRPASRKLTKRKRKQYQWHDAVEARPAKLPRASPSSRGSR